ncbi:CoA transferase [Bradyrhizobium canariense]|uniref:CoA transferase n=1 Tax=Bradyrhizobium canariense TaxID=255045 RepID=A0ABX3X6L8_9BRAD|nr:MULTISPECIES: CoA-transferase [Bradyrhizobium]OSJ18954.1 CoA transferase [Bradyrhizobium canariense]OSJ30479.1 CoA transferase [Bradyrhizobium canariense]WOH61762.1 CoA-transferase [Bradyrhizobium sp. BWC-3-1]
MTKSKIVSVDEAVAEIPDGAKVALGGWIFNSQPMALVRALIRKGARDLHLIPAPGSIAPDMLIGAGCAASTVCVFISFEQFGLAPNFRRHAESGALKVYDLDGPGIAGGLRAGICDLPYMPVPDLGTDLPKFAPEHYWPLPSKPGERKMLAVAAVKPDVCLLHAQQADEHGNVQHLGPPFFDAMIAQASRRVIVSVDRIVSTDTIRRSNHLTKLPSAMVDAIVEAPFGAHPTTSPSLYRSDEAHLKEYVKSSAGAETFSVYLDRYVRNASSSAYLDAIGGNRLAALAVSETNLK